MTWIALLLLVCNWHENSVIDDINIMLRSFKETNGIDVFRYFDNYNEEDFRLLRKPIMNA